MTTYKQLFGKYVINVTSDPTSADAEGQIWYNSTSGTFKTALGSYGVWSSGGNLNTARRSLAGAGTQTATLAFGGDSAGVVTGATESYNGTSWTTLPATMGTARHQLAGCGTQTAALAFAGTVPPGPGGYKNLTESYNGTSWTAGGTMATARILPGGAGTNTAALAFGGGAVPGVTGSTESYNGTSWTSGGTMGTARQAPGSAGTQTATLAFGGYKIGRAHV